MIAAWDRAPASPVDPLVHRVETLAAPPPDMVAALRALALRDEPVHARAVLAGGPRLVAAGWGARQRILADGRRQILSFLLPGDLVAFDPHRAPLRYAATVSLTAMIVADAAPLLDLETEAAGRDAPIARVLRTLAGAEEALLAHQVTRLGRQTAYERMAHLLLELHERLCIAGVEQGDGFTLPVTQEVLADSLGLSIVHTNRTIQQLRRDGLVRMAGTRVTLVEPARLAALADYIPLARMLGRP